MKCEIQGCKCESDVELLRLWGTPDVVGFCKEHTHPWMYNLKIDESTKFYKRVK